METIDRIEQRLLRIGYPENRYSLSEEDLTKIKNLLPPSLFEIFRRYGTASCFNGLFKTCNPIDFRQVLAMIFKADPDFNHEDCSVVAHTAFGYLHIWSRTFGIVEIDLPKGLVFCQHLAPTEFTNLPEPAVIRQPTDDFFSLSILPFSREESDYLDYNGKPMYKPCQIKHGILANDECYGFFPALSVCGISNTSLRVENIKKVKTREHFSLIAQLGNFYLVKVGQLGFEAIREIG